MSEIKNILKRTERDLLDYGLAKNIFSLALFTLEEILFLYKDVSEKISVETIRSEKELYIKISILGENFLPEELEKKNDIHILSNIIKNTNFGIKHEYNNCENVVYLSIERYLPLLTNIKFAFSYFDKDNKHLIRGYIYNLLASLMMLIMPFFSGKLIVAYTNNVFTQVIFLSITILIARILYAIFFSFASIDYNKVSFYLFASLRKELMNKLFIVSDDVVEKNGSGPFMTRINNDAAKISELIAGFFNMISNIVYYLGACIASLLIDPIVFIFEVVTFIILYILERKRMLQFDIDRRKAICAEDFNSGMLLDIINGLSDIKIYNSNSFFNNKVDIATTNVAELNSVAKINSINKTRNNRIFVYLSYFVIALYIGFSINNGTMRIADAIVIFNYHTIIAEPFVALIQQFLDNKKDFSLSCERVIGLLKGNEFSKEINGDEVLDICNGSIEFKNVSFRYEDIVGNEKLVLNDVSFNIENNKKVAFVGKSGSGKSTILKLIAAQRNCSNGCIMIDGIDMRNLQKQSYRKHVSFVSQSPIFFNASIKENLLLAKPDATMEELIKACEMACILDDILNTKNGFDTILNEKGVRFSGGQRQRLAIARIFLRNTKIIIFDEATSALDSITEEKIIKNIEKFGQEHTIIFVAHRLSTVKNVDIIYVISDGKIVGSGKHDELMTNCNEYKELYSI